MKVIVKYQKLKQQPFYKENGKELSTESMVIIRKFYKIFNLKQYEKSCSNFQEWKGNNELQEWIEICCSINENRYLRNLWGFEVSPRHW